VLDDGVCAADETLFEEGDQGDSMYLVVSGRLRIHRSGRTLNFIEQYQVVGEMSALDPEPRSASATAVEETRLLRLDRAQLYRFMNLRPELAPGIIHILCQHLRARLLDMAQDYHYLQQVGLLTEAATAVEAGIYTPETVEPVAQRTDALGHLARVFQRMMAQVYARERQLQQQVQELWIEIDKTRQAKQVSEVTGTAYFQSLRGKAHQLRELLEKPPERE
jgi:CRP-like cAMP-binding protein